MIEARVEHVGKYRNGTDKLEICTPERGADALPFIRNKGVPIKLRIARKIFDGTLRATEKTGVWVSPKIFDAQGKRTRLSIVLTAQGMVRNTRVGLSVVGGVIDVVQRK